MQSSSREFGRPIVVRAGPCSAVIFHSAVALNALRPLAKFPNTPFYLVEPIRLYLNAEDFNERFDQPVGRLGRHLACLYARRTRAPPDASFVLHFRPCLSSASFRDFCFRPCFSACVRRYKAQPFPSPRPSSSPPRIHFITSSCHSFTRTMSTLLPLPFTPRGLQTKLSNSSSHSRVTRT